MSLLQSTDFQSSPILLAENLEAEIIKLPKEFTVVESISLRNKFISLCERDIPTPPRKIILDFSKTDFIDSSGIGALVKMVKLSKNHGIELSIKGLTSQVQAALTLTGLDKVLNIETSEDIEQMTDKEIIQHIPVTHLSVRSSMKRVLDIVGSMVGLVITSLLFIPIALAIRHDGKGPLFFSQRRVGWMGKTFKIWKFRTMIPDAEAQKHMIKNDASGAIFKATNDPRITPIGQFLRRTSLDELPQFWNVLKGDMSLVGTRPPTVDELGQYDVPEWRRLDVKPGITGEWQVNGRSSIKDFSDVIALDLKYQRNWNLFYDIKLILKTFNVIFKKDNGAL